MKKIHSLLKQQLIKYCVDPLVLPLEGKAFVNAVNETYWQYSSDVCLYQKVLYEKILHLQQMLREMKQMQAQLIQSEQSEQKDKNVDRQLTKAACAINNPLSYVYGNLKFAQEYTQNLLDILHLYRAAYPHPTPALQQAIADKDIEFLMVDFPKILDSLENNTNRIYEIVQALQTLPRSSHMEIEIPVKPPDSSVPLSVNR